MQLFQEELFQKLNSVTFDYIYQYPRECNEYLVRHISSNSKDFHYVIIQNMMLKGEVPDPYHVFSLLQEYDAFQAQEEFAKLGDMSNRRVLKDDSFDGFEGIVCPNKLSYNQIILMRLWYEYSIHVDSIFALHVNVEDSFLDFESREDALPFLKRERVLDDEYVSHLLKK